MLTAEIWLDLLLVPGWVVCVFTVALQHVGHILYPKERDQGMAVWGE
jgi:hypothetical protein